MALRVAVARLRSKGLGSAGPSLLRANHASIGGRRAKHFDAESPLAKHTNKRTSTARLVAGGMVVGAAIGVVYTYFSKTERKLPGAIVNTAPQRSPVLESLPPDLKVTRKVRGGSRGFSRTPVVSWGRAELA